VSNFRVRLFSVTARTTLSRTRAETVGVDLKRHRDLGADEAGDAGNHFVGDLASVASDPRRIERHGSVKPSRREGGRGGYRASRRRSPD